MSWWVHLSGEDGGILESRTVRSDGATIALGGEASCQLNVTYNYARPFAAVRFSLRGLEGRTIEETRDVLARAVERLGTQRTADYWDATPGNAGHALSILLRWADEFFPTQPGAVWRVS